ncbi:MAG: hypothetical protein ACC656_08300, partial [Candidatus Heimdallarchaeota archaeon]
PMENTRPNDTVLPILSVLWYFYNNEFVDTLPIMVRNTPTIHMWEYNKTAIAVLKEIELRFYILIKILQLPDVDIDSLPFVYYMNEDNLADLMFKMNLTNYFAHNIPPHTSIEFDSQKYKNCMRLTFNSVQLISGMIVQSYQQIRDLCSQNLID